MKALVISEDNLFVEEVNNILKNSNFDTINYKWLLKAMDNLEEIQPDCIIINAADYSRQWKILVQFNQHLNDCPVLLCVQENLNDSEIKKAEFLKINKILNFSDSDFNDNFYFALKNLSTPEKNQLSVAENETEEELFSVDQLLNASETTAISTTGFYVLTNPVTGEFISGKYLEYDGRKITCKIQNIEDFTGIEKNTAIQYLSYSNNNECKSFSATVNDYLDLYNEKFIVLDICNFYEEN